MLYVFVGEGDIVPRLAREQMEYLWDQVESITPDGEEVDIAFCIQVQDSERPSLGLQAVLGYINAEGQELPYAVTAPEGEPTPDYTPSPLTVPELGVVTYPENKWSATRRVIDAEIERGGQVNVLALYADGTTPVPEDEPLEKFLSEMLDIGIPCFAFNGQMLPLKLEEVPPVQEPEQLPLGADPTTTEEPPPAVPVTAPPVAATTTPTEFTRKTLDTYSRAELTEMVKTRGLTPKDWRAKTNLIDALLGEMEGELSAMDAAVAAPDDTDMTPEEFNARMAAGTPAEIITPEPVVHVEPVEDVELPVMPPIELPVMPLVEAVEVDPDTLPEQPLFNPTPDTTAIHLDLLLDQIEARTIRAVRTALSELEITIRVPQ